MAHTPNRYSTPGRNIILVGIDGVISDNAARLARYVPLGLSNSSLMGFGDYNGALRFDEPITATFQHIGKHYDSHYIVFVTERPQTEEIAQHTKEWLKKFVTAAFGQREYGADYCLMMRPHGDNAPADGVINAMAGRVREYAAEGVRISAAYSSLRSVADILHPVVESSYRVARSGHGLWNIARVNDAMVAARNAERAAGSRTGDDEFRFWRDDAAKEANRRAAVDVPKVAEKGVEGDVIGCITEAMETLKSRKVVYGKSDKMTGAILAILFPDGITLNTPDDHRIFHFLGHAINKLVRFTSSGLQHADSAHDLINYAAFLETLAGVHQIKVNNGK